MGCRASYEGQLNVNVIFRVCDLIGIRADEFVTPLDEYCSGYEMTREQAEKLLAALWKWQEHALHVRALYQFYFYYLDELKQPPGYAQVNGRHFEALMLPIWLRYAFDTVEQEAWFSEEAKKFESQDALLDWAKTQPIVFG